jgi:hypothetical protein
LFQYFFTAGLIYFHVSQSTLLHLTPFSILPFSHKGVERTEIMLAK